MNGDVPTSGDPRNAIPSGGDPEGGDPDGVLAEGVRTLTDVVGEEFLQGVEIGPETAFAGALALESIEFADLAGRLRARFGERADLPALVASLDLAELLGLTVGDLADHITDPPAEVAQPAGASEPAGPAR